MVSIVIPTYNAGPSIDRLLSSLRGQSVPAEIIVIDSSSSDDTPRIVKSHGLNPITIAKSSFNHGATRNLAVRNSTGDPVVFMTQDALPYDDRSIEHLIQPLSDSRVAASYGRQIPREDARQTEKFARAFNYPEAPGIRDASCLPALGIRTFFFSNVFSAIRRKEFKAAGGFPEGLIMFEDMLFAARLILNGYATVYVPGAKVIHSHNYDLGQLFRRYLEAGISFRRNPWFLQYAAGEKEGMMFLRQQISYLMDKGAYTALPCAVAEAVGKYAGYKLGLHYERIPFVLRKRVSGPTDAR
jgi:rhamnosyltransferase